MKKLTLSILTVAALFTMAFTPAQKGGTYTVDNKKSSMEWLAKKVTGQHNGTVNIAGGTLESDGKTIKSGNFEIDMKSIACSDLKDAEWNGKLVGHLKSDDFFSVEKNPTAKFVIKSVKDNGGNKFDVTGDLTIKGITQPITFPAVIKNEGKIIVAVADIVVDRTKYDIKYGSKSFFEGIGDKAIDDTFSMKVNLVATAK